MLPLIGCQPAHDGGHQSRPVAPLPERKLSLSRFAFRRERHCRNPPFSAVPSEDGRLVSNSCQYLCTLFRADRVLVEDAWLHIPRQVVWQDVSCAG